MEIGTVGILVYEKVFGEFNPEIKGTNISVLKLT